MTIETKTAQPTSLRRNWQGWKARVATLGAVRRPVAIVGMLCVMLLVGFVQNVPAQAAAILKTTVHTPGKPHTTDPKTGTQSIIHLPSTPKLPAFTPKKTEPPMSHGFQKPIVPDVFDLDPAHDQQYLSTDGQIEVNIPAGAVTAADLATGGGSLQLQVEEIAPPSGGNAGGTGVVSLGTYLITVADQQGKRFAHGLRKDVTLKLHYGKPSGLDLDHAFAVFNGAHPASLTGVGGRTLQDATHDPKNHTLQVLWKADVGLLSPKAGVTPTYTQYTPSTTLSWDTYPPVAKFGSPDPFNADLNAGALTDGVKIDVPPGPAGAMPNITLAYNSGAVSEQHNDRGAAGWVGEGWSMGLGQISWSEHNVLVNTNTPNWENNWMLTDPFGTSTELIAPNIDASTYYDDTNYNYCANGQTPGETCPIQFHTANETYARVYAYVGGVNLPYHAGSYAHPPCFRVYLANGVMEEFGCTADSIQYYPVDNGGIPGGNPSNAGLYYPVNWMLDMIANPEGDEVHVTYQADTEVGYNTLNYPRDLVMSTIEWDSIGCYGQWAHDNDCGPQGGTGGHNWTPLYRVNFVASHHTVTRLTNTPANCNPDATVRCDDPANVSGGFKAPLVNGTWALNDIQVQARNCPTITTCAAWNSIRDYQLSYEQNGPSTQVDTVTGKSYAAAGYFDLTKIQMVGSDGTTAAPATTLSYTTQQQWYLDSVYTPYSPTVCGPSWNTGGNGGTCALWYHTGDSNSRYLASANNGTGMQQTFSWAQAHNNTHGSATPADPLSCNANMTGYPCDLADDEAWSRSVLTERDDTVQQITQAGQGGTQTTIPVTSRYVYTYQLSYPLVAQECTDCVAGMYWGNQNDGDYLDYYNGKFMGFRLASVSNPDGSLVTHTYNATEGWGVYDTAEITNCPSTLPPITTTCHAAPWWHVANAGHGRETEVDSYDTNGTSLLKKVTNTYTAVCPPSGVTATPAWTDGSGHHYTWDGKRVSDLDVNNPVAVCDVQLSQSVAATYDGGANSVSATASYTYDSYGRVTQQTSVSSSGTPGTILHLTHYVYNDQGLTLPAASRTNTPQTITGQYRLDTVSYSALADSAGNRYQCQRYRYDNQAYIDGQTTLLTFGLPSEQDRYTNCGNSGNSYNPSGNLTQTAHYDTFGNQQGATDADANAGDTTHKGCTVSSVTYTNCATYDAPNQAKNVSAADAKNHLQQTGFGAPTDANGGFANWVTSTTDANNQTNSVTYDALGRMMSMVQPGDTSTYPTIKMAYANWCGNTSAQTPCAEQDSSSLLTSGTTNYVTRRTFLDGMGRTVESRAPLTSAQDLVTYTLYDAAGHATSSVKYLVAAYTGAAGPAAFTLPDSSIATSTATTDGLGRPTSTTDALSDVSHVSYSITCAAVSGDNACYEETAAQDANSHQTASFIDGFGQTIYAQRFTGTNPYTLYASTKQTYDVMGHDVSTLYPDGAHTATATYDLAGRMTASSDPDLGNYTYWHDANDNVTMIADPRGAAGTVYLCYDGLNRLIKKLTVNNCASTTTLAAYTYDSGTNGIGHKTGETFTSNGVSGSYAYSFDARGRQTGWTMVLGSNSFPFTFSYNDTTMPLSVTYPGNDILTITYNSQDMPVSLVDGGATLFSNTIYGANGPTSENVGPNALYSWNLGYDILGRQTSLQAQVTNGSTLFSQSRAYDAVGNVSTVDTTLPAGSDNQAYCYDEQNRLTWAGSTGTAPCQTLTPGSLTAANYQQSYAYDTLNRLTAGPLGAGYGYGDAAHLNALTSAPSYSASYDTAGDMTSRTGQPMTFDAMRRLLTWQNQVTSPTSTASYAYDGEGERVQQTVTSGGTTTTTQYVGHYEDIATTTGSPTVITKYYTAGVVTIVNASNITGLSYLIKDGLGSVSASLTSNGGLGAAQLYTPFGTNRYSTGTIPTTIGYTGQRSDPSGLLYDHSRYYDPSVGSFISADTVQGNNRYGYVLGNPTTLTDPTGQFANGCGMAMEDGMCNNSHHKYHCDPMDDNCSNPHPSTPPTKSNSGGNQLTTATTDVSTSPTPTITPISSSQVHVSETPSAWDPGAWITFGQGLVWVGAGVLALAGAFATGIAFPVALALAVNGIALLLHGVLKIMEAIHRNTSELYKTLLVFSTVLDIFSTVLDVAVLVIASGGLATPAVAAEAGAETAADVAEVSAQTSRIRQFIEFAGSAMGQGLKNLLGFDMFAILDDFRSLISF